ncbi:MAG: hypothetical protein M1837_003502 [Sclerophora amabilis]|nr:MAG: hypothetical protein M1837_003502 [Sclerophora amabilis]
MEDTNPELESFRRQWRAEVNARTQSRPTGLTSNATEPSRGSGSFCKNAALTQPKRPTGPPPVPSVETRLEGDDEEEEALSSNAFHDLRDKDEDRRVGVRRESDPNGPAGGSAEEALEPHSALEHYEKGVERETQGSLGDSLNHYRKAYRLDSRVDQTYKNKYFPPSSTAGRNPNPSNTAVTVPNPAHHSLHGPPTSSSSNEPTNRQTVSDLISSFASLSIPPAEPPTSLSPPPRCPLSALPSEILHDILLHLAILDVASFARLSLVCKRFAYLISTEDRIWKRVASGPQFGFGGMHYRYDCTILGHPFVSSNSRSPRDTRPRHQHQPAAPTYLRLPDLPTGGHPTYQHLFRHRPRLRFGGCYISTVNYVRPGASSPTQISWNTPVHIVTYYRYLRFFRDGTCLSLLSTAEPADVVHHLSKAAHALHASGAGAGLPSAVVRQALRGRWRVVGDDLIPGYAHHDDADMDLDVFEKRMAGAGGADADEEADAKPGDVLIETEGVGDPNKYMYKMQLCLRSVGGPGKAAKDLGDLNHGGSGTPATTQAPAGGIGAAAVAGGGGGGGGGGGSTPSPAMPTQSSRNTKLVWKGFWSYNRLTDDWAEFNWPRNNRAFFWSRVKSYGIG